MEDNKLKIKYNVNLLKWTATIFFLLVNLLFIFYEEEDIIGFICMGVITNSLAIFSFIMLSIFPRIYYVFDENGCSYQNSKGQEKFYIAWDNIENINYIYVLGIIPDGLELKFKTDFENILISPKQAKLVCDTFPKVKALIDPRSLN